MSEAAIPTYTDLSAVYGADGAAAARQRYERLRDAFQERFGAKPELFARSPGRVNLIGEHIDYEGYGVLPMAIRQDTVVAIKQNGSDLVVTNINSARYPDKTFSVDPTQKVDMENHTWANYFLAAYKGVFEHLQKTGKTPSPVGLQVMIDGQVPTGSGLSSSAAFTCSVSLGLLSVLGVPATKGEVAEFTTTCERYVGTESGGMDQAISLMGMPNIAKLVEFNPVRATDVVLPEGATFVIANSLTVSNKAETAAGRYNMRVVECRLAAAVLAVTLGQSKEKAHAIKTLREIEPVIEAHEIAAGKTGTAAGLAAAGQFLHEGPYEQAEIEGLLGVSLTTLFGDNASQQRSIPLAAQSGGFHLRKRAVHVYSEAARVWAFKQVCDDNSLGQEDKLKRLGQLMDDSQASCRDNYHCSCPELDALTGLAKQSGAIGSRLTGAGWGGCTVSMIPQSLTDTFIKQLKDQYFAQCIKDGKVAADNLDEVIFASKPASGGAVLKLRD